MRSEAGIAGLTRSSREIGQPRHHGQFASRPVYRHGYDTSAHGRAAEALLRQIPWGGSEIRKTSRPWCVSRFTAAAYITARPFNVNGALYELTA